MKSFVDHIFREINTKTNVLDEKLYGIEDEEETACHYAKQGAIISEERWKDIENRKANYENQKICLKFLKTKLWVHHNPGNSYKKEGFYLEIINKEVIQKLCDEENYQGCALIRDFMDEIINYQLIK